MRIACWRFWSPSDSVCSPHMHCARLCFVTNVPLLLCPFHLFGRFASRVLNMVCPATRASCSLVMGVSSGEVSTTGCGEAKHVGE